VNVCEHAFEFHFNSFGLWIFKPSKGIPNRLIFDPCMLTQSEGSTTVVCHIASSACVG
jgi:hypothetical protein